jgi:hypothetical protein
MKRGMCNPFLALHKANSYALPWTFATFGQFDAVLFGNSRNAV